MARTSTNKVKKNVFHKCNHPINIDKVIIGNSNRTIGGKVISNTLLFTNLLIKLNHCV